MQWDRVPNEEKVWNQDGPSEEEEVGMSEEVVTLFANFKMEDDGSGVEVKMQQGGVSNEEEVQTLEEAVEEQVEEQIEEGIEEWIETSQEAVDEQVERHTEEQVEVWQEVQGWTVELNMSNIHHSFHI